MVPFLIITVLIFIFIFFLFMIDAVNFFFSFVGECLSKKNNTLSDYLNERYRSELKGMGLNKVKVEVSGSTESVMVNTPHFSCHKAMINHSRKSAIVTRSFMNGYWSMYIKEHNDKWEVSFLWLYKDDVSFEDMKSEIDSVMKAVKLRAEKDRNLIVSKEIRSKKDREKRERTLSSWSGK